MLTSAPPSPFEIGRVQTDRAVARAVWRAVRDERMRVAFAERRLAGVRADEVIEALCGPHVDEVGRQYYLSDERVRSIVYRKRCPPP